MYINNIITVLTMGVVIILVVTHEIYTDYEDGIVLKRQNEANEYNKQTAGKTYYIDDMKLNDHLKNIYDGGTDNPLVVIQEYYKADIGLYNIVNRKIIMWLAMNPHTGEPDWIYGVPLGNTVKHIFEKPVQEPFTSRKPVKRHVQFI